LNCHHLTYFTALYLVNYHCPDMAPVLRPSLINV
jgi:hypothetical protein